jgi:hypothetical protein
MLKYAKKIIILTQKQAKRSEQKLVSGLVRLEADIGVRGRVSVFNLKNSQTGYFLGVKCGRNFEVISLGQSGNINAEFNLRDDNEINDEIFCSLIEKGHGLECVATGTNSVRLRNFDLLENFSDYFQNKKPERIIEEKRIESYITKNEEFKEFFKDEGEEKAQKEEALTYSFENKENKKDKEIKQDKEERAEEPKEDIISDFFSGKPASDGGAVKYDDFKVYDGEDYYKPYNVSISDIDVSGLEAAAAVFKNESSGFEEEYGRSINDFYTEEKKEKPYPAYYLSVKNRIDELFSKHEPFNSLSKSIDESKWVRVDYDNKGQYYIVGIIYEEDIPKFICYGVPAPYTETPPKELKGFCQWLPLDLNYPMAEGFWLMFQDCATGDSVSFTQ